jgi:hypothetical protein
MVLVHLDVSLNPSVSKVSHQLSQIDGFGGFFVLIISVSIVYFLRIEYEGWELGGPPQKLSIAALDCSPSTALGLSDRIAGTGAHEEVEVLDLAFFDDETSVALVRLDGEFHKVLFVVSR